MFKAISRWFAERSYDRISREIEETQDCLDYLLSADGPPMIDATIDQIADANCRLEDLLEERDYIRRKIIENS